MISAINPNITGWEVLGQPIAWRIPTADHDPENFNFKDLGPQDLRDYELNQNRLLMKIQQAQSSGDEATASTLIQEVRNARIQRAAILSDCAR